MIKRNHTIATAAILSLAIVAGCIKAKHDLDNLDGSAWSPEVGAPLVNSDISINDIILASDKNGVINVDANKFCTLVYEGNLFSKTAENVFLPDYSLDSAQATIDAFTATAINALPVGQTYTYSTTQIINLDIKDKDASQAQSIKLDKIWYKKGLIYIIAKCTTPQSVVIDIEMPNTNVIGTTTTLKGTINLPYTGGNVTRYAAVTLNLSQYETDLTLGNTTTNKYPIKYTYKITKTSSSTIAGEYMRMRPEVSSQEFKRIIGDVGQRSLSPFKDTVDVSLFNNSVNGTFYIKNPSIDLNITNSFGVPIDVNFDTLAGYFKNENPKLNLVSIPAAFSPLSILAPNYSASSLSPVDAITPTATLSGANTGGTIQTIMDKKPKQFVYKVRSQTNPGGVPSNKNVIFDNSKFAVDFKLNLPLEGYANNFLFSDTSKFEIGNLPENIERVTLRTFIRNGFPLGATIQLYFLDNNNVTKDSLITDGNTVFLSAAPVGADGRVTTPTALTRDYVIERVRVAKLTNVTKVVVRASTSTTNAPNTNVKIYSDYRIALKLGVIAKINYVIK
ncbi:MAG: hypothetical protein H7331_03080 [Bacteroidia bacterium]|nr:hypothetical protein [Bacteroidia bacterium]